MFPFFTPEVMKENLMKLGIADQYTFDRPKPSTTPKVIDSPSAIRYVLSNPQAFATPYGEYMRKLTDGHGFFVAYDAKTS